MCFLGGSGVAYLAIAGDDVRIGEDLKVVSRDRDGNEDASPPPPRRPRPEQCSLAELKQRTFAVDVLLGPCGARRGLRLVRAPAQIARVLEHPVLAASPPERAMQGVMRLGEA